MLDLTRHAQAQFGLALLVLLVCVAAIAWRNVFGRAPAPDLVLPRWLRGRSLSAVAKTRAGKIIDYGLGGIAAILALLFATMAGVHGQGLDHERVLHEAVQAKYQAELGWTDLYSCAWAADREHAHAVEGAETVRVLELEQAPTLEPTVEHQREIRRVGEDLRMQTVERAPAQARPPVAGGKLQPGGGAATRAGCRERFDDARWEALAADIALLDATAPEGTMAELFKGYGSTASPLRLARQRLVFNLLPLRVGSLFLLSLLSALLVVAALVLVGRAYGLRAAALVGVVCFVEFGASPLVSGASTANALVLAALLAALASVSLAYWGLAGGLLAFAALEAGWPALVLAALALALVYDHLRGARSPLPAHTRPDRPALLRLFGVAAGVAALLAAFSATLPGGLSNWSVWLDRLALTNYADGSHAVGLRWLFTPDGSWLGGNEALSYPRRAQNLVDRASWIHLCGVLLLVPALLAGRRLPPPAFAAIAGVTATFALLSTQVSSWGAALPLLALAAATIGADHEDSRLLVGRPTTLLVIGCLGVCVGMFGMGRVQPFAPWLFNMIYSHLLTTLFLGLGVALLLMPDLRETGDPPGAPASIPVGNPSPPLTTELTPAERETVPDLPTLPPPERAPQPDADAADASESEPEPKPKPKPKPKPNKDTDTDTDTEEAGQ